MKKICCSFIDGGYLKNQNLNYENSENNLIQKSGIPFIDRYYGGGLIDMNSGSMKFRTLRLMRKLKVPGER